MDEYTNKTKSWLDNRFSFFESDGIYHAHQPIYGFRKGHCEPTLINRYIITYQTMKALSHLRFSSLLDVGGAEGYKANIAKKLFNVIVVNSDLSTEACRRAREIFSVASVSLDIHNLPFRDDSFDIILCSETLEHVSDIKKATKELARVAKKAVIITVPHEPKKRIAKNIKDKIPHAHIHRFDLKSFNYLKDLYGYKVLTQKMSCPILTIPSLLVDAVPRGYDKTSGHPKFLFDIYNATIPFIKKIVGVRVAHFLILLDNLICKLLPFHNTLVFVILKDNEYYLKKGVKNIVPRAITEVTVPYYHQIETSTDETVQ